MRSYSPGSSIIGIEWKEVERDAHELCAILENEFIQVQPKEESQAVLESARLSLIEWGIVEFINEPNSGGKDYSETA